ncbi:fatty acid desaturase family protein [bacterium]|nr:fatty acid desaturase family protein [bacterium]
MSRVTDILSREEIKEFTTPSNLHGALAVATTWAIIIGSLAMVAIWPNVLTVLAALILIGGRILGLAILMHEASHRTLFKNRTANDVIGQWLCAYPVWQDLHRYREHHMLHHGRTYTDDDPDLCLVDPFPVPGLSMTRKFLRDLTGVTGLKRLIGLFLMDTGYLTYTASCTAKPIDQKGRSKADVVKTGAKYLHGVVITNAAMFGVLYALGHPMLYLIWVGAYLVTFSLFVRIRSFAEHAVVPDPADPWNNTRTTYANPIARLTVAPHYVNYHLEHHLLMTVPCYKLPRLHRLLRERGVMDRACVEPGYLAVMRKVIKSPETAHA